MNVVLYARVSSHKQADKDLSISAQLRALRGFAHEHGWTIVGEFVDKAISGRTANRPGLRKMLQRVKRGDVDAVLVWKLDRLARDVEIAAAVDGFLRRQGVKLVSLHESFDDSPQGRFIARIFQNLAEFYSNNLSQDICRGIREVAQRGFYPHGRPPIGYTTVPVKDGTSERKKLVPDETYAPIVRRIFSLYLAGKGGREIARILNEEGTLTNTGKRWSPQRIYSILRNPVYVGDLVLGMGPRSSENQKPLWLKDVHEPLVSREDFQRVQEILRYRAEAPGAPRWHSSPYLLSGLVRCGKCGGALCGTAAKSGRFHYYTCSRYYKEGKGSCPGIRVRQEKLESFVLDKLLTVILAPENLERLVQLVNEELSHDLQGIDLELERLSSEIRVNQTRLSRLFDALETGKLELEDLAPRIKDLRQAIERLEERKDELLEAKEARQTFQVDKETVLSHVRDLKRVLEQGSLSERKAALAGLIERIVVYEDKIEIEYRLPQSRHQNNDELLPPVLQSVASGGDERIRTADLRVANAALSQLSYIPTPQKSPLPSGPLGGGGAGSRTLNLAVMGRALSPVELLRRPLWLRGLDSNQQPPGYEPGELPNCSTPLLPRAGVEPARASRLKGF